jgi:hypothetical protein
VGNAHGSRIEHTIPTLKGSNSEGVAMAQTLVSLLVHVIFSTKNRQFLITPEIQKEHHRTRSFKEELLRFLNEYGIEFDERYLWD